MSLIDYSDYPNECVLLFVVTFCNKVLFMILMFAKESPIGWFGHFRTNLTLLGKMLDYYYIVIALHNSEQ